MKLTFLGGADEVGGSGLLVEAGGRRVLIDAGLRPSPKARWGLAGDQLPDLSQIDRAGGLDAILVTHAHTDHTGALELVVGRYPQAPVYATPATIALARVLHLDSRRIMQSRLEEEGELPLFDDVAVEKLAAAFHPVPFQARLPLAEGLVVTFYPAGHIAGAAMIGLECDEGHLLVTGDISISDQRTVAGAKPPPFRPDLLVVESTYGGRLHANRSAQERQLMEAVSQVTGAGGKVLIPAFALGRAQEILLILSEFRRRGELPEVSVWADGMVRAICQAYAGFPDILPLPLQERGARFFEGGIRPVERNQQRSALVWEPGPAVIVSSSGMLAGGPSLSYARQLAGQPQHAILLTGYQDEESPGRRLQEVAERGHGSIRLGKDKVDVQCRLGTYSLSAHADEGQLISLVETVDPAEVMLVHGDESARSSLARALQERGRSVHLPRAGQTLEFRFAASPIHRQRTRSGLGGGQPLDVRRLWNELAESAGYFSRDELARLWWGERGDRLADEALTDEQHAAELAEALARDNLYFVQDERRPELYRLHPRRQVELALQRRAKMDTLRDASGKWVVLRDRDSHLVVRCLSTAADHLQVELEDGSVQPAWPEAVVAVLGEDPPDEQTLARYESASQNARKTIMEPNQALAFVNAAFPPEARLRKTGYRLEQRSLALTFDFPAAACQRYAHIIAGLPDQTGWQVEITPEANQSALNALVSEMLPSGWAIAKGPAIHRESRRVVVTIRPAGDQPVLASGGSLPAELEAACQHYREVSDYELTLALAQGPGVSPSLASHSPAERSDRWEINAAYAAIRADLEGSSLYRTSLKGDEIILSFITPQVGARFLSQIEALSQETGWKLSIHPQANQGAISEKALGLLNRAGLAIQKGPSLRLDRSEVVVTLPADPGEETRQVLEEEFERETGYRLALSWPAPAAPAPAGKPAPKPAGDYAEIPVDRIRLRPFHQSLDLSPDKLDKAVERARRMGIVPPIQVRRAGDGYVLVDGLYRLRAAQALGLATIPAEIE